MEGIGKLIKKERGNQRLTYAELAKKAGCTARAVSYWESGERSPTLEMADKVLKALGISVKIGK